MDHLSKSVYGLAPEPLFPYRGPPSTSGIESFRDGPWRAERAAFRISLDNDGWSRKGSPYSDVVDLVERERAFGAVLRERLRDRLTRQLRLSCSVEVAPDPNNRVELSTTTDALGIPHPKLTFTPPDYSLKGLAFATRSMAEIFRLVGAGEIDLGVENAYDGAGHIMGTCRMGDDPGLSVVDRDCRCHEHRNLFLLGSSVFPSVGTANPTLTIAALALRAADTIASELGRPVPSAGGS
jgi:choline dehydrogenase-like flavoprotein